VGNNGEEQLLLEGTSSTVVEDCELIANTGPAVTNRGAKLTMREAKPIKTDGGR
jgi:hypothetical protein